VNQGVDGFIPIRLIKCPSSSRDRWPDSPSNDWFIFFLC